MNFYLVKRFLLLTFIAALLPTTSSSARTLVYTDHEPLGGMRPNFINEIFFSAIEKESQGRLKIESHWDSELSTGYDALRTIGKGGTADMGIVVPEYAPKELPLHQIFKSFPTGPTGDKQITFFKRVYKEIPNFPAELDKENVVVILFATGFPVAFFSSSPLDTLEDIKGERWRSASFWHKDFLQNAGAIPVTMPWGEGIYTAFKDKKLDGLMVNVDGGYQLKVPEIAPNILFSEDLWMGHIYLLAMNKDVWNGLEKEDQEAILRAADTSYKSIGSVMKNSFDTQIKDLKKEGANVRILKPEELEQWKQASQYQKIQAAWVKEQEEKGITDAGLTMEKVRTIFADFVK